MFKGTRLLGIHHKWTHDWWEKLGSAATPSWQILQTREVQETSVVELGVGEGVGRGRGGDRRWEAVQAVLPRDTTQDHHLRIPPTRPSLP